MVSPALHLRILRFVPETDPSPRALKASYKEDRQLLTSSARKFSGISILAKARAKLHGLHHPALSRFTAIALLSTLIHPSNLSDGKSHSRSIA